MSVFSDRLIALRKEKGLSQYDFAKIMNISRSTISGYEVEGKEPNYTTLRKFMEYFAVSADYMLGLSDEKYNADIVFQKDSINFKKHFTELPAAEKAIVTEAFDNFYMLLFKDVRAADGERLAMYRDLLKSLRENRGDIRKLVEGNTEGITDAGFLSTLMEKENAAKGEVTAVLDKLMQSDLNAALKKTDKQTV